MTAVTPQRRMHDVSQLRLIQTPKKNENARVNAILTQLDIEGKYFRASTQYSYSNIVEHRCDSMMSAAEEMSISLKNQVHIEIMKLPRSVRAMKMKDFLKTYHENPEIVATDDDKLQNIPLEVVVEGKTISLNDPSSISQLSQKGKEQALLLFRNFQKTLESQMNHK